MKKNMIMSVIMAGGLCMVSGAYAVDTMAILQDASTIATNGPKLIASYKDAQKKINEEISLLKTKGITDKEKSLAAVQLINESVAPLQDLVALFKTIDHLIISSSIPTASDVIKGKVDPVVQRAVIMLNTIRQATEILRVAVAGAQGSTPVQEEAAAKAEDDLAPLP